MCVCGFGCVWIWVRAVAFGPAMCVSNTPCVRVCMWVWVCMCVCVCAYARGVLGVGERRR